MTTATAEMCGHRWWRLTVPETGKQLSGSYSGILGDLGCDEEPLSTHRCERPAGHERDMMLRQPPQCRCRCGATTTRKDADHA